DLVAVGERRLAVGVALVDGVQEPFGLVPEAELRPDVRDPRGVQLAFGPARTLAEPGEKADANSHSLNSTLGAHGDVLPLRRRAAGAPRRPGPPAREPSPRRRALPPLLASPRRPARADRPLRRARRPPGVPAQACAGGDPAQRH